MDKCITHQFIFKHTTNNDTGKESYFINGTPVSHNGFYDNQTRLINKGYKIINSITQTKRNFTRYACIYFK